jgi:hypothetical protein
LAVDAAHFGLKRLGLRRPLNLQLYNLALESTIVSTALA